MKRFLLIGTGVALLAGGGIALAQMPPGGPDGGDRGPEGPGPDHGHGPEMHGPHGWRMMREMRHHGGDGGASFRLRRGDMEIDVRCSGRESSMDCVTAAGALLDKVNGGPSSPAPKP